MAVYHFTLHAYSSWMPDHPRGYTDKAQGVLPPDEVLGELYRRGASHPPVRFEIDHQQILVNATIELCAEKKWRLHFVQATTTHVHILVSWTEFNAWKDVRTALKRRLGQSLSLSLNKKGPWFSREGSRKRVADRKHFEHLMTEYLPNHHGCRWHERM